MFLRTFAKYRTTSSLSGTPLFVIAGITTISYLRTYAASCTGGWSAHLQNRTVQHSTMEVSLTKTKYVHNPNTGQIKECISSVLSVWCPHEGINRGTDFAPNGFSLRSVDDGPVQPLQQLQLQKQEKNGNKVTLYRWEMKPFSENNQKNIALWKIEIDLTSLPKSTTAQQLLQANPPPRDRPSLIRSSRGTMSESVPPAPASAANTVGSTLHGYNVVMTLYALPSSLPTSQDPPQWELHVKKFFNDMSYQLHLQLLVNCELPAFNHDGKTFKEMYQLNAKVRTWEDLFAFVLLKRRINYF